MIEKIEQKLRATLTASHVNMHEYSFSCIGSITTEKDTTHYAVAFRSKRCVIAFPSVAISPENDDILLLGEPPSLLFRDPRASDNKQRHGQLGDDRDMGINTKRYLLFGSDEIFYASGGWCDYIGSFASVDEAIEATKDFSDEGEKLEWWHIADTVTKEFVCGYCGAYGSPYEYEKGFWQKNRRADPPQVRSV